MKAIKDTFHIAGKELGAYFVSPIAYVVLTGFVVLTGWFFFNLLVQFNRMIGMYEMMQRPDIASQLNLNEMVMLPLLYNMTIVLLLMIPLITMRLFSEEKKLKTDELLLTSPISIHSIVLGKYLASLFFLLLMLCLTALYPGILFKYGQPAPELGPVVSGYLGLFLLGASFVAVGLFASSLTENQIVAAVVCFVTLLLFFVIGWPAETVGATSGKVLEYLSLIDHFAEFSKGLLDGQHVVYFLSFILFALFLTKRSIESTRWR
jgi:gliding motility-associated transport system permease protein